MVFKSITLFFLIDVGYWMSHMAIKLVYDDIDGLVKAPFDVTFIKEAMYKFFQV
jgi:hypothetical protein